MDLIRFNDKSHVAIYSIATDINNEAAIGKVPPCALATTVEIESGGRNVLQEGTDTRTMLLPDGTRPGVGWCQITADVDWSNLAHPTYHGYDLWKTDNNLYVAAAYFLAPAISSAERLQRDDPTGFARWGDGQILFYAFAGYNEGWGGVMERYNAGESPDDSTTDGYAARSMIVYNTFVAASHAGA